MGRMAVGWGMARGIGGAGAWRERLRRFEAAGQSVARFCARERVSTASFYRWRQRLENESLDVGGAFRRIEISASEGGRIEVTPSDEGWRRSVVTIAFGSGAKVEIPCEAIEAVRAAIGELARIGGGGIAGAGSC